nr:phosphotransferase [uncultured Actinoplanes sp.]
MEEQLRTYGSGPGPAGATLSDGVVLKTAGPWAPGVIALLRHLEAAGFRGAPRVVGDGYARDGRLAVTYLPGSSPHPRAWPSTEAVARIGVLLRELHTATSTFRPPPGVSWQPVDLGGVPAVHGHRDPGPWNIVGTGGSPAAFIDWEAAGPVDPMPELAAAAWLNAQLHDDDIAALHDLPDARFRAEQARALLDGYGVDRATREDFVDRLLDVALRGARAEAIEHHVTQESTEAVTPGGYPVMWGITWRARSASWIARHRGLLREVLRSG